MENQTSVIVVGAGPTGLLSAINLAANKVSCRIFETKEQRSEFSKALAIHAGTLEYLEATHPDLLKKILARGKKIQLMRLGEKYQINLKLIPSKYNFILVLEQKETEAILEEYLQNLGVKVERSCKVVDAKNEQEQVIANIQNPSETFFVSAKYLLDCSGAHSIIRKNILRIPFKGEKYLGKIVMGDVKINSSFLAEDSGYITSNNNGIAAFVPLTDESYFRVILIPYEDITIPQIITIDYFQNVALEIAPHINLTQENKWLTSFEVSRRMTTKLRVGRIFILGDAAHIHSPIGGQGMNLGMQDALNISSKLVKVLIDKKDKKLLKTYEKQRLPIIKNVLRTTNVAMRFGVERSFLTKIKLLLLKKIIAPIFFKSEFLQRKLIAHLAQINSAHQEIKNFKTL